MRILHSRHFRLIRASLLTGVLVLGVTTGCGEDEPPDVPASTPVETPDETPEAPAMSTEELARAFHDAVVAGDREAATAVATDEALAFFEPWEPAPDYTFSMADPSTGLDDTFFISPGAAPFQCTVADARVQGCMDEPTGEEGASAEEVARAFHDAVVAGDRDAAAAVATEEALAFFEPWEPAPDYTFSMAAPSTGLDDTFFISPGAAPFQCTVADGMVQECTDPEAADRS